MRFRIILLLALAAILITMTCGCSIAAGETAAEDSITYDGWDWDNETVNAFTGSIDLSQWSGTEVTLELKAAFEPASESASEIVPKFTHFNGSRLTMLEQKDSFACTPEAGQAADAGTGSLPEDHDRPDGEGPGGQGTEENLRDRFKERKRRFPIGQYLLHPV